MNKLTIIGNLTRDPELRTTTSGIQVCTFTVAVNRRRSQNNDQPEADFFKVSAWRSLAEICHKYLSKGRKVCVVGSVSFSTYTANDGTMRVNLDVNAEDVEFLSSRQDAAQDAGSYAPAGSSYQAPQQQAPQQPAPKQEYMQVDDEELPF